MTTIEAGRWYLAVRGTKWHKAIAGHGWKILTQCGRSDMSVCCGIVREGKDVPAEQTCKQCARNGGAD